MFGILISAGKLKSVHKAWQKERAPTEPAEKDDEDDSQTSSAEHDEEDPEATDHNDDAEESDSDLKFRSSSEAEVDLGVVEVVDEELLPDAGTSARASPSAAGYTASSKHKRKPSQELPASIKPPAKKDKKEEAVDESTPATQLQSSGTKKKATKMSKAHDDDDGVKPLPKYKLPIKGLLHHYAAQFTSATPLILMVSYMLFHSWFWLKIFFH